MALTGAIFYKCYDPFTLTVAQQQRNNQFNAGAKTKQRLPELVQTPPAPDNQPKRY
jgi:hypothetical protein